VNESDEVWAQFLAESVANLRAGSDRAVADYISLKAGNDQIRERGVKWLFDAVIQLAGEANRRNYAVAVEREDPHSFRLGRANMVGSLVRLRHGVRCLTLEAGWTRNPSDGFMRGQALAAARISHFGKKEAEAELHLRKTTDHPEWFVLGRDDRPARLEAVELMRHFAILLGR
jgi:hypothetical protein